MDTLVGKWKMWLCIWVIWSRPDKPGRKNAAGVLPGK